MKKRNNIEISVKGLILAVTVIIALILSAISLYMVTKGKSTINDGNTQYSDLMSNYSEINATLYDGLNVSGDKVIDVIRSEAKTAGTTPGATSTVHVFVINKVHQTADITYPTNGQAWTAPTPAGVDYSTPVYNVTDVNDDAYINPNATYVGRVHKNQNGMVDGIIFTQK